MGWSAKESKSFVTARIMGLKKEAEKHYFEISKYQDGKTEILSDEDNIQELNGKLSEIQLDSYEWEWKTRPLMKFYITDDNWDNVVLSTSYNQISKQLVYGLATIAQLGKIEKELILSLYISKNGNKNLWLKHWGEDIQHHFDWEKDIKGRTEPVMDTKWEFVRYDTTELDKWINEKLIPEINASCLWLQSELEEVEKNPVIAEKTKAKETSDEDLPF